MVFTTKILTIDGVEHATEKEAKKHLEDAIFEIVGPIVDKMRLIDNHIKKAEFLAENLQSLAWAAKLQTDMNTAPDPEDVF